eukprot:scaffold262827_cov55-Attheya_sp.AAC.2
MKLLLPSISLTVILLARGVGSARTRDSEKESRRLADYDYKFVVSQIRKNQEWCLTASNGVKNGADLGFKPCNFDGQRSNQLFYVDEAGMIHSKMKHSMCLTARGESLGNRTLIEFVRCRKDTGFNTFFWDEGKTDQLQIQEELGFCVTNEGAKPRKRDKIVAKKCEDRKDMRWTLTPPPEEEEEEEEEYFFKIRGDGFKGFDGCIEPQGNEVKTGNGLILGSCTNDDNSWTEEDIGDSTVMFHTRRDPDMCLHAGMRGKPKDGRHMRTFPCDKHNRLQHFEWDGDDIKIKCCDFCVVQQSPKTEIGDTIILKNCTSRDGEGWSYDGIG